MALESGGALSLVGIGVTFKRDKKSGAYVVKRIVEGGAAARATSVLPGDVFDEVLPRPLSDRLVSSRPTDPVGEGRPDVT